MAITKFKKLHICFKKDLKKLEQNRYFLLTKKGL